MTTIHFDRVAPGDLIRSDLLNRLIEQVESLETRVAALETGGASPDAPIITGHVPPGDVTAGAELRITGRKFLVPTTQNTVTIDGRAFSSFLPGSNDSQLILDVPADFPNLPRDVTVTVSNRNGSATITARLQPAIQIPHGKLVVADTTGSLGQAIQVGQTYTFAYRLESQTDIAETYDLAPAFSNVAGADAAAWRAGTTILGGSSVSIDPSDPVDVGVRLTVPPTAQSVDFALNVRSRRSSDPLLNQSSSVRRLAVGSQDEPNDPRTRFELPPIGPASANSKTADLDGQRGAQIRFGSTGTVPVRVIPSVTGTYRYSAPVEQADGLWSTDVPSPAQGNETAGNARLLTLSVTCSAPGPAPGRRFIRVRAVKLKDDGSDDFVSFLRFPVEGATEIIH